MEALQHSPLPQSSESVRESADYHPSVWGDYFLTYRPIPRDVLASLKPKMDELKVEIIQMCKDTTNSLQSLELIDSIQRLGASYHFEMEIDEALFDVNEAPDYDDHDLYSVALRFRLLRQQRYHIPSNVFEKFLNENGEFEDSLRTDAKALLSLYEAAHLGTSDEEILDKAIVFSRTHLMLQPKDEMDTHFAAMVSSAMEIPLFRRTDRIRTRSYLTTYERDKKYNEVLLDFAKMDFLCLQNLHQDEARKLSIWWKKLGLSEKLPFSRDRLIECYFWILSIFFEPRYSRARMIMTKFIALISVLDDICDVYGTLEEIHLLSDVIDRWEVESAGKLPEYMQFYILTLFGTFKDIETELAPEQNSFRLDYLKDEFKKIAKGYVTEATWANKFYVPKLEEHLSVTLVTACYCILTCASYIGMEEVIPKTVFDWVSSFPEIIKASSLIGRITNDIASYKLEQKRTHVASTVQCYVMKHECSEEEACNKLLAMSNNAWKILIKEFLTNTKFSLSLIWPIINLARFSEFVYFRNDIYTHSLDTMKEQINGVLIEPIQINKLGN